MSDLLPFDEVPDEEPLIPFQQPEAGVVSVTLAITPTLLEVGTTALATATVTGEGGVPLEGRTVSWDSTDGAIIADPANQVTAADGKVTAYITALSAGSTTIKATCETVTSNQIGVVVYTTEAPPTYDANTVSSVIVTAESRLISLFRPRIRRFNHADQTKLHPTDRFFEQMAPGVDKEIVWPSKETLRRYAK